MNDDAARERGLIEAGLTAWLAQKVWDETWTLRLAGGEFRPLYAEECKELGYADDDPAILLRREPDGRVFEAHVRVTVREGRQLNRPRPAPAAQDPQWGVRVSAPGCETAHVQLKSEGGAEEYAATLNKAVGEQLAVVVTRPSPDDPWTIRGQTP